MLVLDVNLMLGNLLTTNILKKPFFHSSEFGLYEIIYLWVVNGSFLHKHLDVIRKTTLRSGGFISFSFLTEQA